MLERSQSKRPDIGLVLTSEMQLASELVWNKGWLPCCESDNFGIGLIVASSASASTSSERTSTAAPSTTSSEGHTRHVCAFCCDLDQASAEKTLVENHRIGHKRWIRKFDVCVTVAMADERKKGNYCQHQRSLITKQSPNPASPPPLGEPDEYRRRSMHALTL